MATRRGATPAELGKWEQFYVRVTYETDGPTYVRGTAFLDGKLVTSMTSGSMRHEAGTGEAFFWFAYTAPARGRVYFDDASFMVLGKAKPRD